MIAIVYPQFYGVGGIARYLDSYLSNLPPGQRILLVTGDEHRKELSYPGVEMMHIPITSSRFSLIEWSLKVRRLLRQLYADGTITGINFHFPPLIPGLFLPREVPVLLTAHTTYLGMSGRYYEQPLFQSQWGALSLWIKMRMEHFIFRRVRSVITLSEQGRQEVLRYGYKGPMAIIPNGVDLERFVPAPGVTQDIDVLFCGRIERRKGSRPMVELCQRLVREQPQIRICIVGYGDDDEHVKAELGPLPNVTLTGKVAFAEMAGYYRRSKVYVSTSYYEGLPGTCLEAMAMGLPAVVFDFLFYRELVIQGETGWLVAPNDLAAMAQQIQAALADPARAHAMGQAARARLATDFSWASLARQVSARFDMAPAP
ncbi:Glycosyltransferase involved in cell wall bisynthesis [Duganella sacchari]|uniref:Glycosyltransferase involved in cell wall bisynthesis n=1 Tax=Duganella sacchari TaxID=551987 RepID=A0A1M7R0N2_9BURK|nr:glycosyltransferase [Duganella sacchari]SHN38036.1 Glycosyltransferase involved in cell wall bisynthesis [Duganella sacchari]